MNPIAHNPKDFWSGLIYLAIGTAAIVLSRDYGMGTAGKMGAAYFPTVLSGLLIILGVVSLIRSFITPGTPVGAIAWKGLLLVIGSTVLFGVLVRTAGMVIALPVMILLSAYASSRFRWPVALALAAGVTVFCVLIFQKGLGVPMPLLGSWFG